MNQWLNDIEARLAKISSGKWEDMESIGYIKVYAEDKRIAVLGPEFIETDDGLTLENSEGFANANFIANAPTDIKRLIAVARAAEKLNDQVDRAIKAYLIQAKDNAAGMALHSAARALSAVLEDE